MCVAFAVVGFVLICVPRCGMGPSRARQRLVRRNSVLALVGTALLLTSSVLQLSGNMHVSPIGAISKAMLVAAQCATLAAFFFGYSASFILVCFAWTFSCKSRAALSEIVVDPWMWSRRKTWLFVVGCSLMCLSSLIAVIPRCIALR